MSYNFRFGHSVTKQMASDTIRYRDHTKLDYVPPFNDATVARIERIAIFVAVLVGLFGVLYFSLAPAAKSNDAKVSSVQLFDGYNCKMISSVTRIIDIFTFSTNAVDSGTIPLQDSLANVSDFNSQVVALAVSQSFNGLVLNNRLPAVATPWSFQIPNNVMSSTTTNQLKYVNLHFDSYADCLTAARGQTACRLQSERAIKYSTTRDPNGPLATECAADIRCSSLNSKAIYLGNLPILVNRTVLGDPEFGQCNNQANVSACQNILANCESLKRFVAGYDEIFRKVVFTPELLCQPFFDNPPYICTKAVSPSVPSILSQSFAFTTAALAVVKTALFFALKILHERSHSKKEIPKLVPSADAVSLTSETASLHESNLGTKVP